MRIIAADDEELQLAKLIEAIEAALPEAEIHSFQKTSRLLEFVDREENVSQVDRAFLDVQMAGMTGFEIADLLHRKNPGIQITIVSGSGFFYPEMEEHRYLQFIMKPVNVGKIRECLSGNLYRENIPSCAGEVISTGVSRKKKSFWSTLREHFCYPS